MELTTKPITEVIITIDKDEARELTDTIKSASSALYTLLKKAHDENAWVVLGYESWKEYVEKEFDMSRQRSYQLISQAETIEAISTAAGTEVFITEKDARRIKKHLPEITEKIEEVKSQEKIDEQALRAKAMEIIMQDEAEDDSDNSAPTRAMNLADKEDELDDELPSKQSEPMTRDTEAEFYVENLLRTLTIFETLPSPDRLARAIIAKEVDKKALMKRLKFAEEWLQTLNKKVK